MVGHKKTIGIIGGMGPAATVDLMNRIVNATPAKDDCDHLHILVDNNPQIPSRIDAIINKTGESPAPMMKQIALGLQQQGAEILVMPCNTAHYYYSQVADGLRVPFLNMIDLTAEHISKNKSIKKVALLASTALQITGLYEPYCAKYGLELIYPENEDQGYIMDLIKSIKSNSHNKSQLDLYYQAIHNLKHQGADCLLLACTELSVIGLNSNVELPYFDALDILVQNIVKAGLSI